MFEYVFAVALQRLQYSLLKEQLLVFFRLKAELTGTWYAEHFYFPYICCVDELVNFAFKYVISFDLTELIDVVENDDRNFVNRGCFWKSNYKFLECLDFLDNFLLTWIALFRFKAYIVYIFLPLGPVLLKELPNSSGLSRTGNA